MMQRFSRAAIHTHSVGAEWPEFLGTVHLGESFLIETERDGEVNGPLRIEGIAAGEDLAVYIEKIEMVGPFISAAPPFEEGAKPVELEYRDGCFYFPRNFRVQANPTVGNMGVLPRPTEEVLQAVRAALRRGDKAGWRRLLRAPRGRHCHRDCPWLGEGAVLHLKAQVDGAGLCIADVHGYRPAGLMAFSGVEVAANVQLRVERSQGWLVDWPLIETEDRIMVVVSLPGDVDAASADRQAFEAMRRLVVARVGGTTEQAGALVATAVELQPCALTMPAPGMADEEAAYSIVAALPKDVLIGAR
ncbi:MAG: acetamidase/formamidase family protein [Chloroflexi bacterium]|nr:acetamidase/formamidase family protein [Chloroflexota bacterium]